MTTGRDDKVESVVAFVSGALIGIAVTLLFVRIQRNRTIGYKANYDDYHYDGVDLFV
jgi:hypothetical protein